MLFGLADGFTINISSPNTAGLRQLAEGRRLREQIGRVAAARNGLSRDAGRDRPALLVKLSPDMTETDLRRTASICVEAGADGIIATNTSAELRRQLASPPTSEGGGLSGAPLRALAERTLRLIRDETRGAVPLIGVGGIFTAEDAYARIRAGASLVQIYTAMILGGGWNRPAHRRWPCRPPGPGRVSVSRRSRWDGCDPVGATTWEPLQATVAKPAAPPQQSHNLGRKPGADPV